MSVKIDFNVQGNKEVADRFYTETLALKGKVERDIDDAINTFYSEYYEVIENIILYDTPDVKESLIYRITNKGLSIFHIAGKLWLINKYKENLSNNTNNISLDKDLNYILNCYSRLEDCLGSDRKYCILYMTDFTGYTLKDYLQDFSNQLVNIGDTWQDVKNLK